MLCPQRTDDHAVAVLVPAGSEVTSRTAAAVLANAVLRAATGPSTPPEPATDTRSLQEGTEAMPDKVIAFPTP
ncbi:hypothetical protein ACIA5C_48525, partial [Actinoplanes sp. NPDC051343]